jgi:hypothetical protein
MGYCGTTGCQPFGVSTTSGGYVGCQRTVPVAQVPCEDIRTTGTRTTISDDSYSTYTLPFTFNFFGVQRTSILISASGAMSFNTTNPSVTNYCVNTTYTSPVIAVFWEHFHPGSSATTGGVYTQTIGTAPNRRYVVQWESVVYQGGTGKLDVRAVLKEGKGDIDVCYVNTVGGSATYDLGVGATSGIHSGSGTTGLQYSCNTASLVNGLVLNYMAP